MVTEEERQDHVIEMVNRINQSLAGIDLREAQTALTLAVVTSIVSTGKDNRERKQMADIFARQVRDYIERNDIVEWIHACTRRIHPEKGRA